MNNYQEVDLQVVLNELPETTQCFEKYLLGHVRRKTTLGTFVRDKLIDMHEGMRQKVPCYFCLSMHHPVLRGTLIREFLNYDPRLAQSVFNSYDRAVDKARFERLIEFRKLRLRRQNVGPTRRYTI